MESKGHETNGDISGYRSDSCILAEVHARSEVEGQTVRSCSVFVTPAARTLSAGLYLIDFVSNFLVLKEYFKLWKYKKYDTFDGSESLPVVIVPFVFCLALMIVTHMITVIAFKLKIPPEEHPLRSAYFLPLVQFRRFVMGMIQTSSCSRAVESSESLETEALYAIMSAAIETSPQLALQFVVIVHLGQARINMEKRQSWEIPPILLMSLIASFCSGPYNAGRAVMYQLSRRWTLTLNWFGFIAGLYTGGAMLLRICTIASVSVSWKQDTDENAENMNPGITSSVWKCVYFALWLVPGPYCMATVLILVSSGKTLLTWKGQLRAIVTGIVTLTLGPLYPVIEAYNNAENSGRSTKITMRNCLALTACLNILLDVIPLLIIGIVKNNPCSTASGPGTEHLLSSTLTCHEFLFYILTGVAVSVVTTAVLLRCLTVTPNRESFRNQDEAQCPSSKSLALAVRVKDDGEDYSDMMEKCTNSHRSTSTLANLSNVQ